MKGNKYVFYVLIHRKDGGTAGYTIQASDDVAARKKAIKVDNDPRLPNVAFCEISLTCEIDVVAQGCDK